MTTTPHRIGLLVDLESAAARDSAGRVAAGFEALGASGEVRRVDARLELGAAYRALVKSGHDAVALLGDPASLGPVMAAAQRLGDGASPLLPLPATWTQRLSGRWTRRRDAPSVTLRRAQSALDRGSARRSQVAPLRVSSALHPRAFVGFDFVVGTGYRVVEDAIRRSGHTRTPAAFVAAAQAGWRGPDPTTLEGTLNDETASLSDTCWASAHGAAERPAGTFGFWTGRGPGWRRAGFLMAAVARQHLPGMAAARRLVVALRDGFVLDGEIVALPGEGPVTVELGPSIPFLQLT